MKTTMKNMKEKMNTKINIVYVACAVYAFVMKRKLSNLAVLWAAVMVGLAASPNVQAQITTVAELPGNGRTPSTPSAVTVSGARGVQVEVFIRGNDDHIYVNTFYSDTLQWTGWREVQGGGLTISEPEAVVLNNAVRLYIRGGDSRIYQNTHTGPVNPPETGWNGWHEVAGGGLTLSGPAAVIGANGRLNLFIRDLNDGIFRNTLVNGSFGSWQEVPGGGLTISRPEAVLDMGVLKLYVRDIYNGISENVFNGSTWRGWQPVAGEGLTLAGPSALKHSGILKLFITGLADTLFENDFPFNGWTSISSNVLTPSAPDALEAFNAPLLFFRGEDGRIFDAGF